MYGTYCFLCRGMLATMVSAAGGRDRLRAGDVGLEYMMYVM